MSSEGKGSVFYGLHFYPGVAQYQEEGKEPYRVFLNEDTLRKMDPSFTGRPVFVLHVDEVDSDLNELRKEADGWVIESFYNPSDGKHWCKFVVVSDEGGRAISAGMKLSNCYVPKGFGPGGTWNGLEYDKEITEATYEHLAIVPNPRYEESIIMDPEEFKKYNEENMNELKKLSNNKTEGTQKMKFNFFKRTKVENSLDLENMMVVLPKSKKEVTIEKLINDADMSEHEKMAHPDHMVDCNGEKMTVGKMMSKYKDAMSALEERHSAEHMKDDKEPDTEYVKDDDDMMDDDDESMDPAAKNKKAKKNKETPVEDKEPDVEYVHDDDSDIEADDEDEEEEGMEKDKSAKKKALQLVDHEEKEIEAAKKKNAKERAMRLRMANAGKVEQEIVKFSMGDDKIARGKSKYGSN